MDKAKMSVGDKRIIQDFQVPDLLFQLILNQWSLEHQTTK
jgi:hypothetical protein